MVYDVCFLMTCDHLKDGLRMEGLPTSGLKEDLARRLTSRLSSLMSSTHGPTVKQLKYVLWLWRVKDMHGRHARSARYYEINDRSRVFALINQWKSR